MLAKAGDAFAASAEAEPDNAEAYLLAGQAYDQAGQPAEAIEYYNGYLDREPKGENAKQGEGQDLGPPRRREQRR